MNMMAANNNTAVNYPILKLIPLSQAQCTSALSSCAADTENTSIDYNIPGFQDHIRKRRPTLWLKLCSESDDIVDIDNTNNPLEPTRYARLDNDGNYSCELKLGRSEFANISWTTISRSLCDIGMTLRETGNNAGGGGSDNNNKHVTAWIKMRKGVSQHLVHMDGTIISEMIDRKFQLQDGSILSLYGATGFAYRVRIESNGAIVNRGESVASRKRGADDMTSTSAQANNNNESDAKRHKHPRVLQGAQSLIENSTECPLCFGIFVKTVAVHPCGHNFCEECANTHLTSINCTDDDANVKRTECPCCRGEIEGFTRNRLVDTMIWAVALNGAFDRDEASTYLKRREDAQMDAPTEEEKECILRCGKGEQEGIMSGNQMNGPVFMEPMPITSSTKTLIPTLPTLTVSQARANLRSHSNDNEVVDLT